MVLEEMEAEIDQTAEGMGGPSPLTAEIEQKFLISYYVFADAFTVNERLAQSDAGKDRVEHLLRRSDYV